MSTAAVPEKKVVFTGETGDGANTLNFNVKPHIVYPMEEGTALITFEDEEGKTETFTLSSTYFISVVIIPPFLHSGPEDPEPEGA